MSSIWISPVVLERLAGSLLHFVWQGSAIAVAAAVILRLLKRRSPEWRYAAALCALLAMFAAPLLTFAFYAETGALTLRIVKSLNSAATMATSQVTDSIGLWTQWIVVMWMAGVAAFLMRLFGGWLLSRRVVRRANDVVVPVVKEAFAQARERLNFRGSVRLMTGESIETPVVIGWLRPAILLPVSALTGLNSEQLMSILAHELAHVVRHDFLINGMQRALECVLFYHPAVWWISAKVRVERERCCDDLAVRVCGDKLVYAQALLALENARAAQPLLALPSAGDGVTDRVRRLLGVRGANRDWQSAVAALLFALILVGAGLLQPTALAGPSIQPAAAPAQTAPLQALVAIATAEVTRAAAEAAPPEPLLQVKQPTITATREAAREKLGQLRVEYSADSFVKQAGEGDTIAVRTFLLAGMNIDARDEKDNTALIKAVQMGHTETAQALLAAGANPNLTSRAFELSPASSALSIAAYKGDLRTMRVLLAGSSDVNLKFGANHSTALLAAIAQGHRDAAVLLLDNNASVEVREKDELIYTALGVAACNNRTDIARLLLDRGVDVNARTTSSTGQTALHCAAQRTNPELIKLLLDRGADIRVPLAASGKSRSPLVQALEGGPGTPDKNQSALLLIERGADINAATPFEESPLHLAVRWQLPEVVRALLDKGADPNKGRDLSSETGLLPPGIGLRPLITAVESLRSKPEGNVGIALLLIERGADVNAGGSTSLNGSFETTPLLLAIQAKRPDVVRALLAKGANPNQNLGPRTPLGTAAESPEIKKLLIDAGAK